jgi:hypothetical protein
VARAVVDAAPDASQVKSAWYGQVNRFSSRLRTYYLKLAEIKSRIISAFFTSRGEGISELQVSQVISSLGANVLKEDITMLTELVMREHDDPITAYRELSKGKQACGYICDGQNVLYVMARNGKALSCINLTAPTRVERGCTFREVKEAFSQACDLDCDISFKTGYL